MLPPPKYEAVSAFGSVLQPRKTCPLRVGAVWEIVKVCEYSYSLAAVYFCAAGAPLPPFASYCSVKVLYDVCLK